ncbi:MAG: thioredoxin [Chloroflexi bacterium]|nr:thioredoxin [Chloroflexota bacterium]
MNELLSLNDSTFEKTVLQSAQPVLIEFGAVWCAPCKRQEPILAELSKTWSGQCKIVKVDVDESTNLTMQFQVMSVPTMVLIVDGQEVERFTGLQNREKLFEKVEPYLS